MARLIDADALVDKLTQHHDFFVNAWGGFSNLPVKDKARVDEITSCIADVVNAPTVDAVEIPKTGIGDLSDGYHTFNSLYYQRLILFSALVNANKDLAWKSYRHEDGELCFGGGWFIVGIDTPDGSYTYHYENKDFHLFDCVELQTGKHWDGHTEDDVTRLLSLSNDAVEVPDKELLKAIKLLIKQYEHSKRSDYVHDPIAHAFFHTWKQLDESGYGERKGNG